MLRCSEKTKYVPKRTFKLNTSFSINGGAKHSPPTSTSGGPGGRTQGVQHLFVGWTHILQFPKGKRRFRSKIPTGPFQFRPRALYPACYFQPGSPKRFVTMTILVPYAGHGSLNILEISNYAFLKPRVFPLMRKSNSAVCCISCLMYSIWISNTFLSDTPPTCMTTSIFENSKYIFLKVHTPFIKSLCNRYHTPMSSPWDLREVSIAPLGGLHDISRYVHCTLTEVPIDVASKQTKSF